jgi:RHS repeat-associated protein
LNLFISFVVEKWLAWVFESNPGTRYTSGSPSKAVSSQYWAGQMPQEFGSSSSSSYIYSICANYSPAQAQQEVTLIGNPYMFTAREYDIENGLYYYRARYYNPYIGRFLQTDPAYQGMNWYAYCGNNPLNYIDPMGLKKVEVKEIKASIDLLTVWHEPTMIYAGRLV